MQDPIRPGPNGRSRAPLGRAIGFGLLLALAQGQPPARAAGWEGTASWTAAWEATTPAGYLLRVATGGPVGPEGWRAEADGAVERAADGASPSPLGLAEGRLALVGPALRLQLLLDRPHLSSGDPLALISGSRRGDREPAVTLEGAWRQWDLAAQVVRRIDNPGPDGDLASLRLQRWWRDARAALTLFHLEAGMLDGTAGAAGTGVLQQLAALEAYLGLGEAELGAEVVRSLTTDAEDAAGAHTREMGAALVRVRTLPWRPSAPFRLEVGLFQTDPSFRSLASREARLPAGAAGLRAEAHWRWSGGRRVDAELLHARLAVGSVEVRGSLEGRYSQGELVWRAGAEAESWRGAGGAGAWARGWVGLRRGRWEAEVRAGPDVARVEVGVRLERDVEAALGWDRADGGTVRLEARRVGGAVSWRLVWKSRAAREPGRHLYLEGEGSLPGGWFAGVKVGRWDRGRYDALWGLSRRLELTVGKRF